MTARLPDHLDLIAGAPDGIRKLRGLILELAVRGKLVPQDSNDEPASELLKRIVKERARLEAEGVCKKVKGTPVVGELEQPFAIPSTWGWTRLGYVTKISTGKLDANAATLDGDFPFFTCSRTPSRIDRYSYDTEAVLLAGNGDFNIKFYSGKFDAYQRTYVIEPLGITLPYLYRAICQNIAELTRNNRGSAIPYLKMGDLTDPPFPLPPLAEQHRIVAKVDELMALCDRLEAEQADAEKAQARLVDTLLGTLTQSTDAADLAANWQRLAEHFATLFTSESSLDALKQTILQLAVMGKLVPQDPNDDPASELLKEIPRPKKPLPALNPEELLFEAPSNWQWTRLGEVFQGGSGTTPSRARHDYFDRATENWVKTTDLNNGTVTSCEELIALNAVQDCNLTYYPPGTVCVAMYGGGGGGTIGKSGIFGFTSTINQSVFALPPVNQIAPAFAHYYLKSIRGVWMRFAAGLRIAANINGQIIKNMVFPVPPLAEQHRIVAKVDELLAFVDRLKADLAESRSQQERLAATLIESALQAA